MSTTRRAYDILRGYVNYGWERIQGEQTAAEQELREAVEQPYAESGISQDRLAEAAAPTVSMSVDSARRLLDVNPTATSKEIAAAHERVRKAIDPSKFRSGSDAQGRARHLLRLIDGAKRVLEDNLDPTIKRFEGLQIE